MPEPDDDGIEPHATESDGDAGQPEPTPEQLARTLAAEDDDVDDPEDDEDEKGSPAAP